MCLCLYVAVHSETEEHNAAGRRSATTQGEGGHMRQSGDMATRLKPMPHYAVMSSSCMSLIMLVFQLISSARAVFTKHEHPFFYFFTF